MLISHFLSADGANPYAKALLALLQKVEQVNPDIFIGVNCNRWNQGDHRGYILIKELDNGGQVTIIFFDYPLSDTKLSIWYRQTSQTYDPFTHTDTHYFDNCYIDDLFHIDQLTKARDLILEYLRVI